jgi:hypothetical protein
MAPLGCFLLGHLRLGRLSRLAKRRYSTVNIPSDVSDGTWNRMKLTETGIPAARNQRNKRSPGMVL